MTVEQRLDWSEHVAALEAAQRARVRVYVPNRCLSCGSSQPHTLEDCEERRGLLRRLDQEGRLRALLGLPKEETR